MKLRKISAFSKRLQRRKKHGFVLVACLILMMLLIVLFSGSFALAKSQKRVSAQAVLQAQARQQALLGLDAALAELQLNLGPDCRVTANSSILNNHKCPYILGVWDSWDAPLYGTGNEGKAKGKKQNIPRHSGCYGRAMGMP